MPPREVRALCRAKLNLFLDVLERRTDGYHEIVTVFHEIGLADDLVVRLLPSAPEPRTVRMRVLGAGGRPERVPEGPENFAAQAAALLLLESGSEASVELTLTKRIPAGAGLGGGSADAAGALRAVNSLLEIGAETEDLERIGLAVGSDVPFLVRGGTAIGRGRGEVLETIPCGHDLRFLLLLPPFPLSTAAVYRALRPTLGPRGGLANVRHAIDAGAAEGLAAATHNALLDAATNVEPRLGKLLTAARERLGPGVQMSGSGSALFLPLGEQTPRVGGLPFDPRVEFVTSF